MQMHCQRDAATPSHCCRPRLAGTMFQKDLGSLLDKSARVEALVPSLAAAAGLEGECRLLSVVGLSGSQ